jgi:hypothetical protein
MAVLLFIRPIVRYRDRIAQCDGRGESGPHQQVVVFCRVDAESSCALEQNTVDVGFRAGKEPIAQCPVASPASLARRRAMA